MEKIALVTGSSRGIGRAVIDGTGKVLDTTVVYPTYGERQKREAIAKLTALCKKHGVAHIAIGNGTASCRAGPVPRAPYIVSW